MILHSLYLQYSFYVTADSIAFAWSRMKLVYSRWKKIQIFNVFVILVKIIVSFFKNWTVKSSDLQNQENISNI